MSTQIPNIEQLNYKFKELKVYASTEWLADNKKKYRQVFDTKKTTYVYIELSLINKAFDQEAWDIEGVLKCYEIKNTKKKICELPFKKKVNKHDHILYIREGWGNKKEGSYWKKGTYSWEAWVDGVLVGTKFFYIEDFEVKGAGEEEPPVKLRHIRLYEGPYDEVIEEERRYVTAFSINETRYIYAEILLDNQLLNNPWNLEAFVRFYNGSKDLKGQVNRLEKINKDQTQIMISAGWGSNTTGSWNQGQYSIDLIILDQLIASVSFEVGDDFVNGIPVLQLGNSQFMISQKMDYTLYTQQEVVEQLNNLIGLEDIKKQVHDHFRYLEFLKLRKDKGFRETDRMNLHAAFKGNPGTGKTTVAKMMAAIYHKMGLLSKGHTVEVDRGDLVGEYIGQTAPKTKEIIEKARGGVLFIDEAYALARANDDSKDFGKEVIEILIKELSGDKGDLAVIVAGYPGEMDFFLNSNPGLKSRFKHQFEFSDFLPQELCDIALLKAGEKEIVLNEKSRTLLMEIITRAYRNKNKTFGNGRYINDLLDKIKMNMALRIMSRENPAKLSKAELSTILAADIHALQLDTKRRSPELHIDEEMLHTAMTELNAMTGIDNIKTQINELVTIVRYTLRSEKDVLHQHSFHTVLVGNPGTGKTTVARLLARIFKALGLLERGHIVETDRQGLVAGFVGQTAIKTAEKVDEALDGVLFIDEAHALSSYGSNNDFGNEAIQILLKKMEDYRGRIFVIVAGYIDNMEQFLKANPGLSSRFDKTMVFKDYTPHELVEIAKAYIQTESYKISKSADSVLKTYLTEMYKTRDKHFGNARVARSIVNEAIRRQNLRLSRMDPEQITAKIKLTLEASDFLDVINKKNEEVPVRARIGFK